MSEHCNCTNSDKPKKKDAKPKQGQLIITLQTCDKDSCPSADFEKPGDSNVNTCTEDVCPKMGKKNNKKSKNNDEVPEKPSSASDEDSKKNDSTTPSTDTKTDSTAAFDNKSLKKHLNTKPILPLVPVRDHGPGCAIEVSILEKHDDNCPYKKGPNEFRKPEDKVGNFECVGRLTFKTCTTQKNQSKQD